MNVINKIKDKIQEHPNSVFLILIGVLFIGIIILS